MSNIGGNSMSIKDESVTLKTMNPSEMRDLVMSLYDIQHTKIILTNRFRNSENNISYDFIEYMEQAEATLKTTIKQMVTHYPIHVWLVNQKGIEHDMAAQLVGLIQDIEKFDNVSSLWSYCGYGVIKICTNEKCGKKYLDPKDKDEWIVKTSKRLKEQFDKKKGEKGKAPDFNKNASDMLCSCKKPSPKSVAQRKIKNTLLDYNPKLKSLCWRYSKQFVMQGDFYRAEYEKNRAEYETREDLATEAKGKKGKESKYGASKGTAHIDNMSKRKMVKLFLSHLWAVWRELEGLSVSKPYIIAIGGHSKYIAPPGPTIPEINQRMIDIPKEMEKKRKRLEKKMQKKVESEK